MKMAHSRKKILLLVALLLAMGAGIAQQNRRELEDKRKKLLKDSGLNSARPASLKAMNQATSTCTRRCIRPNSDSNGRSAATRLA